MFHRHQQLVSERVCRIESCSLHRDEDILRFAGREAPTPKGLSGCTLPGGLPHPAGWASREASALFTVRPGTWGLCAPSPNHVREATLPGGAQMPGGAQIGTIEKE